MPHIKLVCEVTLDDVNESGFKIDSKELSRIPTGGSIIIDLSRVKESMDSMSDKITKRGEYHTRSDNR